MPEYGPSDVDLFLFSLVSAAVKVAAVWMLLYVALASAGGGIGGLF